MSNNKVIKYKDLNYENYDIFFDLENDSLIYHNKENKEPLYKQQNYIEKYGLNDIHSIILENLKTHNYVAINKSKYIDESKVFQDYDSALLFVSSLSINRYEYEFYVNTVKLIKNNEHPLQKIHTPYLCYNYNSNIIYKGINHFNIIYKNNSINNENQAFISNDLCITHNIKYSKDTYGIIILTKYDYINNKEIYDNIIPISKTNLKGSNTFKSLNLDKPYFFDIETDSPEIKIIKILKSYFYSVFTNTEYIPFEYTKSNEFKYFFEKHPALFIRLINKISFEYYKGVNEIDDRN